jgi:uncharacterized protein (DUF1697 family)
LGESLGSNGGTELRTFIALLRAVNVGGTGKLPMSDLKAMCEAAGFAEVRTFIASGNVLFNSEKSEAAIKAALEASLRAYAGKPIGVLVRTAVELAAVLKANPFPKAAPDRTVVIFLNGRPPATALKDVSNQAGEEVRLGKREIYVHYPDGIGKSRLKIPAAADGTARNMNTIAKLTALAG